jgi:hypothetical protein
LYTLAIDNFLCGVTDVFVNNFTSFTSAREEEFATVKSGSIYTMKLEVFRTQQKDDDQPDYGEFELYRRASAFGAPVVGQHLVSGEDRVSFSHVTPPHFEGPATALLSYTASYDGKPTVDEILTNLNITYDRQQLSASQTYISGNAGIMQLDSSYNFREVVTEDGIVGIDLTGTKTQKSRWLIQSKFETPILNFAGAVSSYAPAVNLPSMGAYATPIGPDALKTIGMWHQKGRVPNANHEGVFARIAAENTDSSLAHIVGIPAGDIQRVGALKKEFKWEEAVVAVPFEIHNNRRKFIDLSDKKYSISVTYKNLELAMKKYNFPPRLDFTKFETVDPILMYVFEFSADMSQDDIANIWQNLLPTIGTKFETSEVIVEEKELLDILLEGTSELQWMVFKVKKRVAIDFERKRRALVTPHTGGMATFINEKYSYNWPYDYASLVELVQLEENVQWASRDATSPETITIDYDPLTAPKFNSSACRDDSHTQEGRKRISAAPMPPNLKSSLDNKKADGKKPADWDLPDQGKPPAPPRFEADGKPESKGFDGKIKKKKGK